MIYSKQNLPEKKSMLLKNLNKHSLEPFFTCSGGHDTARSHELRLCLQNNGSATIITPLAPTPPWTISNNFCFILFPLRWIKFFGLSAMMPRILIASSYSVCKIDFADLLFLTYFSKIVGVPSITTQNLWKNAH